MPSTVRSEDANWSMDVDGVRSSVGGRSEGADESVEAEVDAGDQIALQTEQPLEHAGERGTDDSIIGVGTSFPLIRNAVQTWNAVEQHSPSTMPLHMPSLGQYNQSTEGQELTDRTVSRPGSTTDDTGEPQATQSHLTETSDEANQQDEKDEGDAKEGDPEVGTARSSKTQGSSWSEVCGNGQQRFELQG